MQVVVGVAFGRGAVVFFLADVELATDDRLHARVLGRIDEMDGAENVAMIGHGDGRHVQIFDASARLLDLASAVEHGEISVQMEMYEFRLRHVS